MNPQWSDEVKERYTKDQEFYEECTARGIQIRLNTDTLNWEGHMTRHIEIEYVLKAEDDDDIQDYKKPWVGLTDKEVEEIAVYPMNPTADLVRAIERKLKEKNA